MTLIACFQFDGNPILLADLLLSRFDPKDKSYRPFRIPTHNDPNNKILTEQYRMISGLVQKTCVLTEKVAVAWSGDSIAAGAVIGDLKTTLENAPLSFQNILSFLDQFDLGRSDLSLVGVVLEDTAIQLFGWPDGSRYSFCFGDKPDSNKEKKRGDAIFNGSGASDFRSMLKEIKSRNAPNTLAGYITHVAGLSGSILGDQMRVGRGLQEFYGGGFELVFCNQGKLQKLEDISYLFLEITVNEKESVEIIQHKFLRTEYRGEVLLIHSIQPAERHSERETYVVRPSYRSITKEEEADIRNRQTRLTGSSRIDVIYLFLPQAPIERQIHVVAHHSGSHTGAIVIDEQSDGVDFILSEELMEKIRIAALAAKN